MVITQFHNPKEEKIDNDVEVDINETIKDYNTINLMYKTDDKDVIIAEIEYIKAMQALH